MKNLARVLISLLFLTNLIPFSAALNNNYELSFKQVGEKTFFYLNDELWFPKTAIYDPNAKYWKTQSPKTNVEKIIDEGFNAITLSITSEWVTDQDFIHDNLKPTLDTAQTNDIPVFIKFHVAIWEMLPDWQQDPTKTQYMMQRSNCTYSQYPDYASTEFIKEYLTKIDEIIDYTEQYPNIVAYILEDSDFWSIPEDVTEYSEGFHSIETSDTLYPYNNWIREDFIDWLKTNNFTPQELCLDSLDEAYLPTSLENATTTTHWLAWKEYRRTGYTLKALETITQHIHQQTNKPLGIGIDIGYRYNDMDQLSIPTPELDQMFDFVNAYLGWEPTWMSAWRGNAMLDLLDIPVIGFFDVYWKEVYPALYITGISPYVSGYQVALPTDDDQPNLELLDEITDAISYVEKNELYKTKPIQPKVTLLTSLENAMYAGQSHNPYANSDPYHFSQNGYYGILTRNGVPVTFTHESSDINDYPVTIAGATTMINTFSSRYTSITEGEIQDYLNKGNTLIKGPYPIRAQPPTTLRLGTQTEPNSQITHTGDWSDPENIDGVTARYTGTYSEIKCPIDTDSAYELKITFKDIYHEDQQKKLWIEVQTPTGWQQIQETYYPGCFLLNVWREISFIIPDELLTRPETIIRITGDDTFPVSRMELAPLSNLSPIPKTMIYNWQTELILPSGSNLDTSLDPIDSPDTVTEYLESLEGDSVILLGNNEGVGTTGNLIIKRPIGNGTLIKIGFELGVEWFRNIMKDWSYTGYYNTPLEQLLTNLILDKPDIKLYNALNTEGENINDQIICIPVKTQSTNMTKIIILNPTNNKIQFTLEINPQFFDTQLEGKYIINETLEPLQATSTNYEPELILINQINLENERANKGESQKMEIHAAWYRNTTSINHGSIIINNRIYPLNSTGWARVTLNEGEHITIMAGNSQIFKYITSVTPRWDSVNIDLTLTDTRIDVGETADLEIDAFYQCDSAEFNGEIQLSDTLTNSEAGLKSITALSITDTEYELTVFTSNTVQCIWDQVAVTETGVTETNPVPGETVTYWARTEYQYDSTSFDNTTGTLYADGEPMKYSKTKQRWEKEYTREAETTLHPKITDILDNQYQLTQLQDNTTPVELQYKKTGIPGFTIPQIIISLIITLKIKPRKPTNTKQIQKHQQNNPNQNKQTEKE